jgi:hypothetical protein
MLGEKKIQSVIDVDQERGTSGCFISGDNRLVRRTTERNGRNGAYGTDKEKPTEKTKSHLKRVGVGVHAILYFSVIWVSRSKHVMRRYLEDDPEIQFLGIAMGQGVALAEGLESSWVRGHLSHGCRLYEVGSRVLHSRFDMGHRGQEHIQADKSKATIELETAP